MHSLTYHDDDDVHYCYHMMIVQHAAVHDGKHVPLHDLHSVDHAWPTMSLDDVDVMPIGMVMMMIVSLSCWVWAVHSGSGLVEMAMQYYLW